MDDTHSTATLAKVTPQEDPFVFPGTSDDLERVDLKKLRALVDLREKQRVAEFQRQLKLRETEHKQRIREIEAAGKSKQQAQALYTARMQMWFKMAISASALGLGTLLVMRGYHDVGYFLIGGGLTSVTSNTTQLMKESRR